ncbi:hypothetical protein F2Q70_00028581 [Brassica cretica]|uniref:Uncharacterized protein n=1 Tax=Brassica cretica TaxID=69181 RepID=A0A8S9LHU9_BRACR|nr:hypothetical protein F2Q70_00028581 [Brassica cretica]
MLLTEVRRGLKLVFSWRHHQLDNISGSASLERENLTSSLSYGRQALRYAPLGVLLVFYFSCTYCVVLGSRIRGSRALYLLLLLVIDGGRDSIGLSGSGLLRGNVRGHGGACGGACSWSDSLLSAFQCSKQVIVQSPFGGVDLAVLEKRQLENRTIHSSAVCFRRVSFLAVCFLYMSSRFNGCIRSRWDEMETANFRLSLRTTTSSLGLGSVFGSCRSRCIKV